MHLDRAINDFHHHFGNKELDCRYFGAGLFRAFAVNLPAGVHDQQSSGVDFSAAFPSIERDFMPETLQWLGVSYDNINFLKAIYDRTTAKI